MSVTSWLQRETKVKEAELTGRLGSMKAEADRAEDSRRETRRQIVRNTSPRFSAVSTPHDMVLMLVMPTADGEAEGGRYVVK